MGIGEVGFGEVGFGEVGIGEVGFGEVGFGEVGFGEVGGHRYLVEFLEMTEPRGLYKRVKRSGPRTPGRNLEVNHKKDLRKMKWNFGWRLPENGR